MILQSNLVDQHVDRGFSHRFLKEVVVTDGAVPLSMIRKRSDALGGGTLAPVLLVHGFGQNRYAWHLPSRSFANYLAYQGFDVFNVDLRGHGRSHKLGGHRCRGVAEYVLEDIPAAVEAIQSHSGGRPVFLVGHSLGGLVSYCAAPRLGSAASGVAALGSPYHFTRGSLSLSLVSVLFRGLAMTGIPLGNPTIALNALGMALAAFRPFAESPLYPIPWRGWHKGSLESHVLEEHLNLAFDRAGLGELANLFEWATEDRLGGVEENLVERFESLDLPLLVVAGRHDDLAPPASVRPCYDRSRSSDRTYKELPFGHIDMLVGKHAPSQTWPLVSQWLAHRCGQGSHGALDHAAE